MEAKNSYYEDEIDLMDYIRPLLPRWKLLLIVVVLGGIASLLITRILPKQYRSTAVVFVQQSSGMANALKGMSIPFVSGNSSNTEYINAILESNSMRTAIINELDLSHNKTLFPKFHPTIDDTLERLDKVMSITQNKSGAVTITVTTADPYLSAKIANKSVDLLGNYVVTASTKKVEFTRKKLGETVKELNEAQNDLRKFMETYQVISIDDQSKDLFLQVGTLDRKILTLKSDLARLTADLSNSCNLAELTQKEVQRRSLEASLQTMEQQKAEIKARLMKLPSLGPKYADIQRRLLGLGKTYELLAQQYQLARVAQQGENGDYQVLDRAMPRLKKVGPKMGVNTALGMFISFLIASVIINITSRRPSSRSLTRRVVAEEENLRPVERK